MKVWWVLVWDQYYPSAGLGNVRDTFETESEANEYASTCDTSWGSHVEVVDVSQKLGIMKNKWDESSYEDE
jgi:hypothetical protein